MDPYLWIPLCFGEDVLDNLWLLCGNLDSLRMCQMMKTEWNRSNYRKHQRASKNLVCIWTLTISGLALLGRAVLRLGRILLQYTHQDMAIQSQIPHSDNFWHRVVLFETYLLHVVVLGESSSDKFPLQPFSLHTLLKLWVPVISLATPIWSNRIPAQKVHCRRYRIA